MTFLPVSALVALCSLLISSSTFAATGKGMNPDIGLNFLTLYRAGNQLTDSRTSSTRQGFSLQEAEVQFTSDVDPYFRAVGLFAVAQEDGETGYGIDPEEVYAETTSIPVVTFRTGKYKLALGRHNLLHTHAFPFIDAPWIHRVLLGDEGLNEAAVSSAVLVPAPWYLELTAQAFDPSNDTSYGDPSSRKIGGLGHLKNLWDLSSATTLEWGLSGSTAANALSSTTTIYGSDLTLKWRPTAGGESHSLSWSTEFLMGNRKGFTDTASGLSTERQGGVSSWVQFQLTRAWWIQGRGELIGIGRSEGLDRGNRQSFLIGLFPSEFSGIRAQVDRERMNLSDKAGYVASLQLNFSIGAHPAHNY